MEALAQALQLVTFLVIIILVMMTILFWDHIRSLGGCRKTVLIIVVIVALIIIASVFGVILPAAVTAAPNRTAIYAVHIWRQIDAFTRTHPIIGVFSFVMSIVSFVMWIRTAERTL